MKNHVKLFEEFKYDPSGWGELGVGGLEEILRTVYEVELVSRWSFPEYAEDDYRVSLDLVDVTKNANGMATSLAMVLGGDDSYKIRVYDRDTCAITFSDGHPVVYVDFENMSRNRGLSSLKMRIVGLGPIAPDVVKGMEKWPPTRRFLLDIAANPEDYGMKGIQDVKRVIGDLSWVKPEEMHHVMSSLKQGKSRNLFGI
jgi:hypothetical protein